MTRKAAQGALMGACLTAFALMTVVATGHAAETLAEKLGYSAQDKLLIIHADDVGMCHSVNRATIDALQKGIVTCGSIMVPCPWLPEIAAYCREHPEVDLGLHLTLNCEWGKYRWGPVASRSEVPTLLDKDGYMWHGEMDTVLHASPAEVEKELRAQIEKALQLGIKPTHLDSHMGTIFVRPDYINIYVKLAKEYNIPPLAFEYTDELGEYLGSPAAKMLSVWINAIKEKGFPLLNNVIPDVGGTLETKKQAYENALRNLKPGVTELIVHLGFADDELRAITGSAPRRQFDYEFFTAETTRKLMGELGIKLVGWKDLKKLCTPEQK